MADKPLVNCWTEWGQLEYICVGNAANMAYPGPEPVAEHNYIHDYSSIKLGDYMKIVGPRPAHRIQLAQRQLDNLVELIEGECIKVATVNELEKDIQQELIRNRSYVADKTNVDPKAKLITKQPSKVCRPPTERFDHLLMTPYFKNYYQVGLACPRDMVITMGNTILECPTPCRARWFESLYYHKMIKEMWHTDKRIQWKSAPRTTCADSMYDFQETLHPLAMGIADINETEISFESADMMRCGKDVFYRHSAFGNYCGLEWLRREFPHLRFHAMNFPTRQDPHIDCNLLTIRPPSAGSEGIVLLNRTHPPVASEMQIFKDNDWRILFPPPATTDRVSPVAICHPTVHSMNFLMLSPKCAIIEECERGLFTFLEDLGFDVITAELRALNEFGGGLHCVTWDIRRDDACVDFFPEQDYDEERARDMSRYKPGAMFTEGL